MRADPSLVLCAAVLCAPAAYGVTAGQVDDFENGTTQGWTEGAPSPNPPVNVANGGPLGAGDAYLQNTSAGGSGAGSRMIVYNRAQWSGDYLAAGVTRITAQLANLGANPLHMRISVEGAGTIFGSAVAFELPPDGQWYSAEFDLSADGLAPITGAAGLDQVLRNVVELRLLSAAGGPSDIGDPIAGVLGADNISAAGAAAADLVCDRCVDTTDLAAGAVNNGKILDAAVASADLAAGAVTADRIAAGAITGADLADLAVTQTKLAQRVVGTNKFADAAVTRAKIAADAIGTNKIENGVVTLEKFALDVQERFLALEAALLPGVAARAGAAGPAGRPAAPSTAGPPPGTRTLAVRPGASAQENCAALRAVLAGIADNGPGRRYLVALGPGVFDCSGADAAASAVVMREYVDLEGSGHNVTRLVGNSEAQGRPSYGSPLAPSCAGSRWRTRASPHRRGRCTYRTAWRDACRRCGSRAGPRATARRRSTVAATRRPV